jgi:ParB family chromosome partitioning protein
MYLANIDINLVEPPARAARAEIDEHMLDELTDDVRRNGVLIPLHVRPTAQGYQVIAGHRRLLAARAAGLAFLRCLVAEVGDAEADTIKLTENLYRQELSPVEEGAFFAELFDACEHDVDRVCARVGKGRSYVEGRLLLLSGDTEVLKALASKKIVIGVAQELNRIEDETQRHYYLGWAISEGATQKLVRFWRESANARALANGEAPPTEAPEVPIADPDPNVYQCFICGDPEPMYDLQVVHIHRACRCIVEKQVERA